MNSQSVAVTIAEVQNIDDIVMLENQNGVDVYSKKTIKSSLENQNYLNLVASVDGVVVGYISAVGVLDECELLKIIVEKSHRRCGFGSKLLKALLDILKARKCKSVLLEVRVSNEPAKSLYKSFGFEKISERVNYYKDGETAEVYRLSL